MKITNNTVLITGGGSGIGFETAKAFVENGNKVIITGRNEERLAKAASQLPGVSYIRADVTNEGDVHALVSKLTTDFPDLNILMNNAGVANIFNINDSDADVLSFSKAEMATNYFAPINLITKFLPLLTRANNAAIINVSSVVAFAPSLVLPTYNASKAALHSFTQILRLSVSAHPNLKVFELMPPLVDTDFARDIPSANKIAPSAVAAALIEGLAQNNYEIRVASVNALYNNFLGRPDRALLAINGLRVN